MPQTAEERETLTELYINGTVDIVQAASRFSMLGRPPPEALRLQISGTDPPLPKGGMRNDRRIKVAEQETAA